MKVYTDASPSEIACVPETGLPYCKILIGNYTSNEAEYQAIIEALKHFPGVTEILSDSQLAVNQLNYKWAIKENRLRALAMRVRKLCPEGVIFTWVPREQNKAGKLLG